MNNVNVKPPVINPNMQLADINRVGVIVPPNELYKPVIWNDRVAEDMFVKEYTGIINDKNAAKPKKKFGVFVIK